MIYTGTKTVAAAGTAEPLSATKLMACWLIVQGKVGNSDKVYVGDSTVSAANGICLDEVLLNHVTFPEMQGGYYIDLGQVYVDAAANDDDVNFIYGIL